MDYKNALRSLESYISTLQERQDAHLACMMLQKQKIREQRAIISQLIKRLKKQSNPLTDGITEKPLIDKDEQPAQEAMLDDPSLREALKKCILYKPKRAEPVSSATKTICCKACQKDFVVTETRGRKYCDACKCKSDMASTATSTAMPAITTKPATSSAIPKIKRHDDDLELDGYVKYKQMRSQQEAIANENLSYEGETLDGLRKRLAKCITSTSIAREGGRISAFVASIATKEDVIEALEWVKRNGGSVSYTKFNAFAVKNLKEKVF